MLGGLRLKVSYTHEKTCFAYISTKYSSNNEQAQGIQVLYKGQQVLLWVVFSSNIQDGQMALNPIFCRLVGLVEGAEVFVSPYSNVKVLDEMYIDADSPDDQEILEHNAEILQLRILDQLRVVAANQKAVVWITVSLPIIFTPKQTGLLVNHSRVIIKVDAFNTFHNAQPFTSKISQQFKEEDTKFLNIGNIIDGMLRPYLNPPKRLVLRGLPIDSDGKKNLIHPFTVFIHEDLIKPRDKDSSVILATIKTFPSVISDNVESEDKRNPLNEIFVEIVPIDHVIFRSLCREVYNKCIPTLLIPKSLNTLLNIENGMKIMMTIIGDNVEQPDHIDIITTGTLTEMEIVHRFKTCVIENTHSGKKFLINNGMVKQNVQISPGLVQFKLQPEKLKYTMLNSESLRHCTIAAKVVKETELSDLKPSISSLDYDYKNLCRTLKSFEELIKKILAYLCFEIHREAKFKGASEIKSNVLVTGVSGMGKSSICQIVQKELTVWSHILHCRSLKGRKDIPEVLGKAILMCQEHSPSVLICDDVDSLVPPNLEGASPQDIAYYQRLAIVIKHTLQSCAGVSVLMTANSMKSLHPTLSHFTGKPLFTAHLDIPLLDLEVRTELLKHLVNNKIKSEFVVEDDDVTKLAIDTAGQNVREITDYLNRIIFKAFKRKNTIPDIKPRLLEDQSKDKDKSTVDVWTSLGGMESVKQELTEAIFWPLMYPSLFPSQSCGVLLYGPPGSGKTQIGRCLAECSQISFLAVKGPELLSKYIGDSEKRVRDVFTQAEMKRPCVLFFDEFDSLAPKRGHDSTGVTDRVVTALLAALDGAEGGAAGPVLAATSRPDLLDPALLRPGRLERWLCCGMPDISDRHKILQTLARDVSLSPDIDLRALATRTEGFSPADLKALLVTAQLTGLEEHLENPECKEIKTLVVTKEDVEKALMETKPSLSKEQLRFYDSVYKRFRGERLTPQEAIMSTQFNQQRATLA